MTAAYVEVIGDPIAHSKSPTIHDFWLEALDIGAAYRATHVTPGALPGYFAERKADPDWRGCNITIPHKVAALDHVEDRGGVRDSIGAINTVLRAEDGGLIGTNTDAAGFFAPIAELELAGRSAVVVGAGGAARAVLFALRQAGVDSVVMMNRTPLKAAALLTAFGLRGDALPLDRPAPPAALLVNASPMGMAGQPPLDIDIAALPEDALVYDLVYAPLETDLLRKARARELAVIDGLEMLIGQAAIAFELFFDAPAPRDRDDELRERLTQ